MAIPIILLSLSALGLSIAFAIAFHAYIEQQIYKKK
jgi:zinc transporter ZupT